MAEVVSKVPQIVRFEVVKGDSFRAAMTVKEGGTAKNLTDWTAKMVIKTNSDDTALVTLTVGSGITITAVDGLIQLDIADVTLGAGDYRYDLQLTNTADDDYIQTVLAGVFSVQTEITT